MLLRSIDVSWQNFTRYNSIPVWFDAVANTGIIKPVRCQCEKIQLHLGEKAINNIASCCFQSQHVSPDHAKQTYASVAVLG